VVLEDHGNITGLVVERPRAAVGCEDGDAGLAADEERPLVRVRVPVHLAERARVDDDVGGRHGLGHGEVGAVDDADLAAVELDGLLLEEAVGEAVLRGDHLLTIRFEGAGDGALEDVLLLLREGVEGASVHAEVLGEDVLGSVGEVVGEEECGVFAEVAVVEDEEKFSALLAGADNRVGVASWEVPVKSVAAPTGGKVYSPEITFLEIVNIAATLNVEDSHSAGALENIGPLSLRVPMQLSVNTRLETHVHASEFLGSTELTDCRLTSPATFLESHMAVCETPLHIGHLATIGRRRLDERV
jgi:hypothetical protein